MISIPIWLLIVLVVLALPLAFTFIFVVIVEFLEAFDKVIAFIKRKIEESEERD